MLINLFIKLDTGIFVYYLSDNRDFLGDILTITVEDLTILEDLLFDFPFVKQGW
uniref:Uncharacterized protein n=1 Tax=Arracacha latent virus C TaxID=2057938 RepID=A0A3S5WLI7_9CLOS|nr:hypothetical protein [Arracacha latent virus C]